MERETLEEAMERLSNVIGATGISDKHSFMLGTFWQREQDKNKYSEEDMREAFENGLRSDFDSDFNEFIEQFKKFKDWFEKNKKK